MNVRPDVIGECDMAFMYGLSRGSTPSQRHLATPKTFLHSGRLYMYVNIPSGNRVRMIVNGTLGDSWSRINWKPYDIPTKDKDTRAVQDNDILPFCISTFTFGCLFLAINYVSNHQHKQQRADMQLFRPFGAHQHSVANDERVCYTQTHHSNCGQLIYVHIPYT